MKEKGHIDVALVNLHLKMYHQITPAQTFFPENWEKTDMVPKEKIP